LDSRRGHRSAGPLEHLQHSDSTQRRGSATDGPGLSPWTVSILALRGIRVLAAFIRPVSPRIQPGVRVSEVLSRTVSRLCLRGVRASEILSRTVTRHDAECERPGTGSQRVREGMLRRSDNALTSRPDNTPRSLHSPVAVAAQPARQCAGVRADDETFSLLVEAPPSPPTVGIVGGATHLTTG